MDSDLWCSHEPACSWSYLYKPPRS